MIGVFDSGIGGLTVLRALKTKWPKKNFIYLADTARLPYGSKSVNTIHKYSQTCVDFLKNFDLSAIVIACNSASAAHIEMPVHSEVPIFNVIEPGARAAVQASKSKCVGVLATRATVQSQAYVHALKKLDSGLIIHQQPCPLLVPLVEEGWVDDPITNLVVYRYVNPLLSLGLDTLILGCTHYPVLKRNFRNAVGNQIELVDSTSALMEDLNSLLKDSEEDKGSLKILCTDFSPRLEESIRYILGDVNYDSLELVDL